MILRQDGFVRGSTRDPWLRERAQFVNQTEEVDGEEQDAREGDDSRSRRGARTDVRRRGVQAFLKPFAANGGEGVAGQRSTSERGGAS